MDANDLVTRALLELPERVEKLERTVREQHFLLGVLLARTGLKTPEEIERAFDLVAEEWRKIENEVLEQKCREWSATPEGKEARRKTDEEYAKRHKKLWKSECLTEGRIVPYGTPPRVVEPED